MRFVDTNVLIFAISPDTEQAGKRNRSQDLRLDGDLAVSVQVLQEFYWQATQPSRRGSLSPEQALQFIDSIREFPVQDVSLALFRAAVSLSRRFGLSYWDGSILAARAHAAGTECTPRI